MSENSSPESPETPRSSLKEELAAMEAIGIALEGLDESAKRRVFDFLADRFGLSTATHTRGAAGGTTRDSKGNNHKGGGSDAESPGEGADESSSFADIGALYDAAVPTTDTERALVAAYWFQIEQTQADWGSQQVNDALKNLGHGITNITRALGELISRKPNLVRQLQKSGSSKQARKTYRLTDAGVRKVRAMINGSAPEE